MSRSPNSIILMINEWIEQTQSNQPLKDVLINNTSENNLSFKEGTGRLVILFPDDGFVAKVAINQNGLLQNKNEESKEDLSYTDIRHSATVEDFYSDGTGMLIIISDYFPVITEVVHDVFVSKIEQNTNKSVKQQMNKLLEELDDDNIETLIDNYLSDVQDERDYIHTVFFNKALLDAAQQSLDYPYVNDGEVVLTLSDIGMIHRQDETQVRLIDFGYRTEEEYKTYRKPEYLELFIVEDGEVIL